MTADLAFCFDTASSCELNPIGRCEDRAMALIPPLPGRGSLPLARDAHHVLGPESRLLDTSSSSSRGRFTPSTSYRLDFPHTCFPPVLPTVDNEDPHLSVVAMLRPPLPTLRRSARCTLGHLCRCLYNGIPAPTDYPQRHALSSGEDRLAPPFPRPGCQRCRPQLFRTDFIAHSVCAASGFS